MHILIVLLIVLVVIFLALYIFLFHIAVRRWKHKPSEIKGVKIDVSLAENLDIMREGKKWFLSSNPERVTITSYDGLRLVGFFLEAPEAKGTILLMHGYRSDGFGDFSCAYEFYHSLGYNMLVVHQRAHGESEGKNICYGVRERFDCQYWAYFIAERFGGELPIFLAGMSMGATTVLMASALDLPENVVGVLADCGFTSAYEVFAHIIERTNRPYPARIMLATMNIMTRMIAGFGLREASTVEALKETNLPVFIAHGEDDNFVPTYMGRQNSDAITGEKVTLFVPKATHGMSFVVEPEKYKALVTEFLDVHDRKWRENNERDTCV